MVFLRAERIIVLANDQHNSFEATCVLEHDAAPMAREYHTVGQELDDARLAEKNDGCRPRFFLRTDRNTRRRRARERDYRSLSFKPKDATSQSRRSAGSDDIAF